MKPFSIDRKALEITAIYLLLGILWILFSDIVLLKFFEDEGSVTQSFSRYQTYKGWFFVLFTSLVLYLLVRYALAARTAADKILRESLIQTDQLLSAGPVVLYVLDIIKGHLKTSWSSENLTLILGYSRNEFLAPDWWSGNLYEPDRNRAMAASDDLLTTGIADHNYRFLSKNKDVFWIHDTARVIYDSKGKAVQVSGSWTDVSLQHRGDERQRLYAAAFDNIAEGIMVLDLQLKILSINKAALQIFGYAEDELVGSTPAILKSGYHSVIFFEDIHTMLMSNGVWHGEIWNRSKNGDIKPQWLSVSVVNDAHNKPEKYVAVYTDISELKNTEAELQHLAHHDALTGLPNPILFRSLLDISIAQAENNRDQLVVLFIDLDNFKNIIDSMGHTVGDELLLAVAQRLQARSHRDDILGRQGGDEFLLLSEHIENLDRAEKIARLILDALSTPFELANKQLIYVGACIGISAYPQDGTTAEALLRNASTATYSARRKGRNAFSFYTDEMSDRAVEQLQLETELRQSIERKELQLFFQPKISLSTGEVTGAEGLLRWTHPKRGQIPPARFIPIAEKSGLITKLGSWVIYESCRQIRQWLDQGINPINIAINVSIKQFTDTEQNLADVIRCALDKYQIPSHYLSIEITESLLMENSDIVKNVLMDLRTLGIEVGLDDFGTGFSNLIYLAQLPVDIVKIDISFIRSIGQDRQAENLVRSVINLANAMNLRTVAEGVENTEQLVFLLEHGCDELQGFLFSKPVDAENYLLFLRQHNPLLILSLKTLNNAY